MGLWRIETGTHKIGGIVAPFYLVTGVYRLGG
jgi:hypothetical protein